MGGGYTSAVPCPPAPPAPPGFLSSPCPLPGALSRKGVEGDPGGTTTASPRSPPWAKASLPGRATFSSAPAPAPPPAPNAASLLNAFCAVKSAFNIMPPIF